jgi:cobalt-zinc-cadmium efflux system outer membrane protein
MARPVSRTTVGRAALLALLALGCASTSPRHAFDDVTRTVERRTGQHIGWSRGTREDAQVERATAALLARELTAPAAVQIALLNNKTLSATYEELSISQADLVQAGLLKNPVFSIGVTVAEGDRLSPNLLLGVTWDFLDVLMMPARRKIAASELEATKARVAAQVLDLAGDVEAAYYGAQAAAQIAAMRRIVADAARASLDLATEQHAAGNSSELALATERASSDQLTGDLARSVADENAARERLTRLLGLWGGPSNAFRLPEQLPPLPPSEAPLGDLEAVAVAQRLDLEALRHQRDSLERALSLVRVSRFVPGLGVGLEAGRLASGNVGLGPGGSLELPIFDQKQAVVARLSAMLRATEDRIEARAVDVRSLVREAHARVAFARQLVAHYQGTVVPGREVIVALSQEQYDAMLLGAYQLIAAKQAEVDAYRELIVAARDYWLARVDLERAVGSRVGPTLPGSASASPRSDPPELP